MSWSSSSSLPADVRALLARERSRRRAAEDWATFLVATLDSYVRASHAYDRVRSTEQHLDSAAAQASGSPSDEKHRRLCRPTGWRRLAYNSRITCKIIARFNCSPYNYPVLKYSHPFISHFGYIDFCIFR